MACRWYDRRVRNREPSSTPARPFFPPAEAEHERPAQSPRRPAARGALRPMGRERTTPPPPAGERRLSSDAPLLLVLLADRYNPADHATTTTYPALASDLGRPVTARDVRHGVQSVGRFVRELRQAGAITVERRNRQAGNEAIAPFARFMRFTFTDAVFDAPNLDGFPYAPSLPSRRAPDEQREPEEDTLPEGITPLALATPSARFWRISPALPMSGLP